MSRDELITENMNLVYFLLSKYYPSYQFDEDLAQVGMLGLIQAADTWDEEKSKFSTYASRCILNEFHKEFRNRNKQMSTISLETLISDDLSLGDVIRGVSDVDYVDLDNIYSHLTEREAIVLDGLKNGCSSRELGEQLGCSKRSINQIKRKIELKWRKYVGD